MNGSVCAAQLLEVFAGLDAPGAMAVKRFDE